MRRKEEERQGWSSGVRNEILEKGFGRPCHEEIL
jgi:hypothetical protein